jgi:hypothetical protein
MNHGMGKVGLMSVTALWVTNIGCGGAPSGNTTQTNADAAQEAALKPALRNPLCDRTPQNL